jgi:hypothetical protein
MFRLDALHHIVVQSKVVVASNLFFCLLKITFPLLVRCTMACRIQLRTGK